MIRNKIYAVDEILSKTLFIPKKNKFLKDGSKILSGKEVKVLIDGELINMASDRYKIFSHNRKCVSCGLEGTFMAMEKHKNDISYHFNMYGIDKKGKEILFTKDHINPRSKNGRDDVSNYQTMCVECNKNKGNKE